MSCSIPQSLFRASLLAAGLLLAGSASAQAPRGSDLLEQFRDRNAIAAQQLENDVRDAIVEAQRLAKSDAVAAVERLKKAVVRLEDDTVLTPTRRDALVRDLKERIRIAETDSRRGAQRDAEQTQKAAQVQNRRADQSREDADQEKIRQLLSNVRSLQAAGKSEEASRLAADLAQRYPTNLAVQVASRTASMGDRVNDLRHLRADGERRRLLVYQDVERSAMLPIGDIEFPKDWAEKTKLRKAKQNPMTEREKAILESLSKMITLDVKDMKLEEVIDSLEKQLGQSIEIDKVALDQLQPMVTYETPVTLHAKRPVAARTVLRQVFSQLGLAYVIKGEAIYVTSAEKAKQMMTTRTYYLGDLIGLMDLRFPPLFNQMQMAQNVANIIDTIQHSVDPDSWAVNDRGGAGTITFYPPTMSLIVKQSAEIHFLLGGGVLR